MTPTQTGPEIETAESSHAPAIHLRPARDARPPAQRWIDAGLPATTAQPTLLDALQEIFDEKTMPPRPRGVRVHADAGPGAIRPAPHLPPPTRWAAILGLGIAQVLAGLRPISQLQSWLAAPILADLRHVVRTRGRLPSSADAPGDPRAPGVRPTVVVVSVRAQCPTPTVAEATVHLRIGNRPVVLGARLVGHGQRWVCTALVRPDLGSGAVSDFGPGFSGPRCDRGTS